MTNAEGILDVLKFNIEELGFDSSIIDNIDLTRSLNLNEKRVYSHLELGFDWFDLESSKGFDVIYCYIQKKEIRSFKDRDELIVEISNKIKEDINNLFSKWEVSIDENKENPIVIKEVISCLKNSKKFNFKILIVDNSVINSLNTVYFSELSDSLEGLNLKLINNLNFIDLEKLLKEMLIVELNRKFKEIVRNKFNILSEQIEDNEKVLKSKISTRKDSLNVIYDYYSHENNEDKFINVLSRTFSTTSIKIEESKLTISGQVYSAKLYDLFSLYELKGKSLFLKNIRLGIENILSVDSSILNTLYNKPQEFWYLNNGVTMLIGKDSKKINYSDKLRLEDYKDDSDLGITVINGAQTINSAAKFFTKKRLFLAVKNKYEFDRNEKKTEILTNNVGTDDGYDPDKEKEIENKLLDMDIKYNSEIEKVDKKIKIIEQAEKDAYVMLKVVELGKNEENQNIADEKINSITVSLNRQKPVSSVDLAYTLPIINKINQFNDEHLDFNSSFKIVRRGDAASISNQRYTLDLLPRILYMFFYNSPGGALSKSVNDIIAIDKNKFINSRLFPDIEISLKPRYELKGKTKIYRTLKLIKTLKKGKILKSDLDIMKNKAFNKYYSFVNFAMKLYDHLGFLQKELKKNKHLICEFVWEEEIEKGQEESSKKYDADDVLKFSNYSRYLLIYVIVHSISGNELDKVSDFKQISFEEWTAKINDVNKLTIDKYAQLIQNLSSIWNELTDSKDRWQIKTFKQDKIGQRLLGKLGDNLRNEIKAIFEINNVNETREKLNEELKKENLIGV